MRKPQHEPERRCIITGEHGPRAVLIRLALGPDGQVAPDIRARAPGRGAWIGVDRANLEAAMAKGKLKGALARAFKTPVSFEMDLGERAEAALQRASLDRLGLEAKASNLLTGADKIDTAIRKDQVSLLLHADDAAEDGKRKLDGIWGRKGLVLPVGRDLISPALGRENAVHMAIINKGASKRVLEIIGRWAYFVGRQYDDWPCENDAQGPSGRGASTDNNLGDNEGLGLSE
jgi:uncharacterized protein